MIITGKWVWFMLSVVYGRAVITHQTGFLIGGPANLERSAISADLGKQVNTLPPPPPSLTLALLPSPSLLSRGTLKLWPLLQGSLMVVAVLGRP